MVKHDWKTIEKEYTEGLIIDGKLTYPTQGELSKKYKIDKAYVSRQANKGSWDFKKENFYNKFTTQLQQKKVDVIADEGSKFDKYCFDTANKLLDKVNGLIDVSNDPKDINALASAIKQAQTVGKTGLGDNQTDNNEIRIKVNLTDD